MERIVRPDGQDILFTYDDGGRMAVLTTPSDAAHAFDWNRVDHNTEYDPPLSAAYTYAYVECGGLLPLSQSRLACNVSGEAWRRDTDGGKPPGRKRRQACALHMSACGRARLDVAQGQRRRRAAWSKSAGKPARST